MRWKLRRSSSSSNSRFRNLTAAGQQKLPMATNPNNSSSPLNVNEEYNKALRTKSFLDMWSKVHHPQLRRTLPSIDQEDGINSVQEASLCYTSPRTEPASSLSYAQLPDFVLEPSQESLVAATAAINDDRSAHLRVHSLLLEYFDTTFQACAACASLLASISRARVLHRSIRDLMIKLSSACFDVDSSCAAAFDHLASLVDLKNPLHPQNFAHFYSVQSDYGLLTQQLTRAHRRILRRVRLLRLTKKAAGIATISACSVAVAVALVIAAHTVVGIGVVAAAAPVLMTAGPRAAVRWAGAAVRARHLEKLGAQVDAAAKGAYIVGRDFDTMSRMVRRAHDEVEHQRDVARMVLRGRERQLAREAAREVEGGVAGMAEQLQELEEHVYLCLTTINRSRMMVAQEMMGSAGGGGGQDDNGMTL